MKKSLHQVFIAFLFIYALFIGMHIREIIWDTQTVTVFVCGLALAICAHARKNYITLAILVLHMGIEWFEWSQERLTIQQIVLNLLHIAMDFIFLSHEIQVHVKRYRKIILVGVLGTLLSIFCIGYSIPVQMQSVRYLEPFVIAGVLGCILSHLYFHIKKE